MTVTLTLKSGKFGNSAKIFLWRFISDWLVYIQRNILEKNTYSICCESSVARSNLQVRLDFALIAQNGFGNWEREPASQNPANVSVTLPVSIARCCLHDFCSQNKGDHSVYLYKRVSAIAGRAVCKKYVSLKGVRKGEGWTPTPWAWYFTKKLLRAQRRLIVFAYFLLVNLSTYCKYHGMNLHANFASADRIDYFTNFCSMIELLHELKNNSC